MLTLTKKTDYALIALSHLARCPEGVVSAREIAGIYKLPLPILTNILKTLGHAGVLISERGATGGYGLAKPAEAITLHKLIAAIEGPLQFVRCVPSKDEANHGSCELELVCPIRASAQRIRDRLRALLEDVTLAELLDDQETPEGLLRPEPMASGRPGVKES